MNNFFFNYSIYFLNLFKAINKKLRNGGCPAPIFYEVSIVVVTDIIAILLTPCIFLTHFLIQICIKFISMVKNI